MKNLLISLAIVILNVDQTFARVAWGKKCTSDTDCANTYGKLPVCCGTAEKDPNYKDSSSKNWAKDGVTRTVCNYKYSTTLVTFFEVVGDDYSAVAADIPSGQALSAGYTFICLTDVKKSA